MILIFYDFRILVKFVMFVGMFVCMYYVCRPRYVCMFFMMCIFSMCRPRGVSPCGSGASK